MPIARVREPVERTVVAEGIRPQSVHPSLLNTMLTLRHSYDGGAATSQVEQVVRRIHLVQHVCVKGCRRQLSVGPEDPDVSPILGPVPDQDARGLGDDSETGQGVALLAQAVGVACAHRVCLHGNAAIS